MFVGNEETRPYLLLIAVFCWQKEALSCLFLADVFGKEANREEVRDCFMACRTNSIGFLVCVCRDSIASGGVSIEHLLEWMTLAEDTRKGWHLPPDHSPPREHGIDGLACTASIAV